METEKANDTTFKTSNRSPRARIGLVAGLSMVAVAVVVVLVVVVVQKKKENETEATLQQQSHGRFISVRSSGLIGDYVTVTIRYYGDDRCSRSWLVRQMLSDFPLQYQGSKQKIADRVFETSIRFENTQTRGIFFRLYCGDFTSVLALNTSALVLQSTVQDNLPDVSNYTFTVSDPELNATTGDVKVVLTLNEAVNASEIEVSVYMDGLNTSSTPNSAFEIFDGAFVDSKNTYLEVKKPDSNNGIQRVEIVVPKAVAIFGGLLVPLLAKSVDGGFVKQIEQGVSIPIKSTETGELVPDGQFGMYRQVLEDDQLTLYSRRHSFTCFIFGSTKPTAGLVVTYPNGTKANIETDPIVSEAYIFIWVTTVEKAQFPGGGTFTCRATLGLETQTVQIPFRFDEPEHCSINSTLTGILEQTGQHDMVQCTVTGSPKPKVHVMLYDEYGPDLLEIPDFQVSKTSLDDNTVSVNLTVTPVNTDIHTVVCVCQQQSVFYQKRSQEIVLHPGVERNYTLYDEFHRRIYGIS